MSLGIQRVFITGGGSGLGKALALFYAKKGFAVAICDIDENNLVATEKELNAITDAVIARKCNTANDNDLAAMRTCILDAWDGLDILINNAGIAGAVGDVDQLSPADWEKVFKVNVFGVVNGCRAFIPLLKQQGSGAIVNIASMAGLMTPPNMAPYNTSKAAVVALTETLKFELHPFGVSAHVVCPAFFKTNLTASMESSDKSKQFVNRLMESSTINADDIAAMIHQQIENDQLVLLTHKKERNLWRFKRYFPRMFVNNALKTFAKSIRKKAH